MLVAFVLIELRVRRPMLDLSLFKYQQFVSVQLLPIATCYSYVVLLILLPLRFLGVQELSEIDAGLLMLALSAPMLFVLFIAANLVRWILPSHGAPPLYSETDLRRSVGADTHAMQDELLRESKSAIPLRGNGPRPLAGATYHR